MIHHGLGVAVIAAGRNFLAPDPRIKRVIAPLDLAILTHGFARHLKVVSVCCSLKSPREHCCSHDGYMHYLQHWSFGQR
jgi:hypothetical protein